MNVIVAADKNWGIGKNNQLLVFSSRLKTTCATEWVINRTPAEITTLS